MNSSMFNAQFLSEEAARLQLSQASPPAKYRSIPLRFQGGVAAQRPGWLVKGRVASLYARVAILILFEITNHPVCAGKERDLFINGAATPP